MSKVVLQVKDVPVSLGVVETVEPPSEIWTSKVLSNQVNEGVIVQNESHGVYDVYGI